MPVPCEYCGCLLDSYSDRCDCPAEQEARAQAAKAKDNKEARNANAVNQD